MQHKLQRGYSGEISFSFHFPLNLIFGINEKINAASKLVCYVISCLRDVSKYIRVSTTRLSVYSFQRKRKVLSCSSTARIHTQLTLCVPLGWLTRNRNQTLPLTVKNWKLTQCNKNVDKAMGLIPGRPSSVRADVVIIKINI